MKFFGKSYWRSQEQGIQREWLLTNGIGGFASGTIIGMNARRYHGLLVASLMPPVERYLILSGISESVHFSPFESVANGSLANHSTANAPSIGEGRADQNLDSECSVDEQYYLHTFRTPDFQAHGEYFLEGFYRDIVPEFHYRIGSMTIRKKVCLRYGMNQAVVVYHIRNQQRKALLRLTPLVNYRNYHYTSCHQGMTFSTQSIGRKIEVTPYDQSRRILLDCSEGKAVTVNHTFFYNMTYPYEQERGLNGTEDHYIPGYYEITLMPGEEKVITLICSLDDPIETLDGEALIAQEAIRQKGLLDRRTSGGLIQSDPFLEQLVLAADQFIVYRRSTDAKTIIAGYPWFTDWGRDTMIALPGLTLSTGRFNDAREILYTFAQYQKDGLIPNVFPDGAEKPAYNTVDAALWYFEAVYKTIQYTKDIQFVNDQLVNVLESILRGYEKGTLFHIQMDKDYLITAGNEDTQLTWMDAKVGSWVVTPRHGKAAEINALWYNALRVMAEILEQTGSEGAKYRKLAAKVKKAFVKTFWNEKENCLFDVVNTQGPDGKIRPNQIIAVSLSFPVLEGEQAKGVVDTVYHELYTALGLRSLSRKDSQYRGIYIGDPFSRDGAYHQGTVWTWPLGRFITAYARVYQNDAALLKKLEGFFLPFADHLNDACIGSISEIFDGDEPLIPRGCCAQAWSVSEILRAYVEDYLPLKRLAGMK